MTSTAAPHTAARRRLAEKHDGAPAVSTLAAGHKTLAWAWLKEINREVATLAPIMSGLTSTGVFFSAPAPAQDAQRLHDRVGRGPLGRRRAHRDDHAAVDPEVVRRDREHVDVRQRRAARAFDVGAAVPTHGARFADIKTVTASNGDVYFHSDKYLVGNYAVTLLMAMAGDH